MSTQDEPDNTLRTALGRIITTHVDATQGAEDPADRVYYYHLGELLGARGKSAKTAGSRMGKGESFPDRNIGTIAEFVGLDTPGILRALADEVEHMAHEGTVEPVARRRGAGPGKRTRPVESEALGHLRLSGDFCTLEPRLQRACARMHGEGRLDRQACATGGFEYRIPQADAEHA